MKKILITGANSFLAKSFINICKDKFYIIAVTTTEFLKNELVNETIYVHKDYEKLKPRIKECDYILHFAWTRKSKDNSVNLNFIDLLMKNKKKDSSFYFISSVAASPKAISTYGKQKYEAYKLVLNNGEKSIILGSVISPINNQIKILLKIINLSPFSIRFSYNFFKTYNIEPESFNKKLLYIIENNIPNKSIVMFDKVLKINDLLKFIENKYEIKRKYKFIIPVFFIKFIIYIIQKSRLKFSLIDKILTFTYKDDEWLNDIQNENKKNL